MRLLTKTSLLIITVSVFIFFIWNIVFFQITRDRIMKQVDSELFSLMHGIMQSLHSHQVTPHSINIFDFAKIEHVGDEMKISPMVKDTLLFDKFQNKFIPHRILTFTFHNGKQNHIVQIQKSLLETDLVIEKITLASVILILIFVIAIYFVNRYIFENVWAVFFATIQKMDRYDVKSKEELKLEESEIIEFKKLNNVLQSLVNRIRKDYDNLKELTANTSHEIQTPLAIIKSKTELLMQSENISEKEMELIHSILETSDRLSKLNQSLLLIAKIENDQYIEMERVDARKIIEKHIEGFEVLIEGGELQLESELDETTISINPVLLDILITNLLKNAMVHNEEKGIIKIDLHNYTFSVLNSGPPLNIDPNQIFQRFVRNTENQGSSGLGLEIVKKICDYYELDVSYSYADNLHCFTVNFEKIA